MVLTYHLQKKLGGLVKNWPSYNKFSAATCIFLKKSLSTRSAIREKFWIRAHSPKFLAMDLNLFCCTLIHHKFWQCQPFSMIFSKIQYVLSSYFLFYHILSLVVHPSSSLRGNTVLFTHKDMLCIFSPSQLHMLRNVLSHPMHHSVQNILWWMHPATKNWTDMDVLISSYI